MAAARGAACSLVVVGPFAASPVLCGQKAQMDGSGSGKLCVRRMKEVAKERATTGETAARRAAAMAERCRNMIVGAVKASNMAMMVG